MDAGAAAKASASAEIGKSKLDKRSNFMAKQRKPSIVFVHIQATLYAIEHAVNIEGTSSRQVEKSKTFEQSGGGDLMGGLYCVR